MPDAQQSETRKKYQPEQDQARQSKAYPSQHAKGVVRDRDTRQTASERADERERRPEGQTIPQPRNSRGNGPAPFIRIAPAPSGTG